MKSLREAEMKRPRAVPGSPRVRRGRGAPTGRGSLSRLGTALIEISSSVPGEGAEKPAVVPERGSLLWTDRDTWFLDKPPKAAG